MRNRFLALLAPLALAPALAAQAPVIFINELDCDQTGTDANEFIELFSPCGGVSLDDCYLVLYNGAFAAPADAEYATISLDGLTIPADGYFVIGQATVPNVDFTPTLFTGLSVLQNGQDAAGIWWDSTGALTDLSFDNTTGPGGTAPPPAGAILLDAVCYDTADADDAAMIASLTPGQPQIDEDANLMGTTQSIQRFPDGGTPLVTSTYVTTTPTPGVSNGGNNPWTDLGSPLAGTLGDPVLVGTGTLVHGNPGSLELDNANPSSLAYLFVGLTTAGGSSFKGGTLWPFPIVLQATVVTDAFGSFDLPWSCWPAGVPTGTTLYFQYWIADPAGPKGAAASNGLLGTVP